jgi:DNA-binding MarR family transcriptional regulator
MKTEPVCADNYPPTTTYAGGVTKNQPRQRTRRPARTTLRSADEQRWADLADLALIISREIQFRGYTDERALSLTQSEATVMRYVLQGEPAAPSQIAAATGLQRTNLSTTLRGLEHKGLIQRQANPSDGRGVTVSPTECGRSNYFLVRHEWAIAVAAAAGYDPANLDAALTLLTAVKDGLIKTRPQIPSRHPPT